MAAVGGAIASAFVSINPDLKPMEGVGSKIKAIMANPITGIATAAIGVGVALLDIGTKFQTSFNAIARGTGATGDQLNKLKGDFKTVLSGTAGSFQQVQEAIIGVSRATGLTGPPLDNMAKQFVTLARITKTDVAGNIQATEPLFAKFNIAAKDQGKALDVLFKASQASGLSVADLAGTMQHSGTILKDFGYSFTSSAALIASFTKAGVNADQAMAAMKKGFASFAKAGQDPEKAMSALVDSIKKAPTEAAAAGLALKTFGAKAGAELVSAIRSGKLNIDELTKSISSNKDGIMATANATPTLAGAFAKLKNQALVALEPIATKFLGLATIVVGKIIPVFRSLFAEVGPIFKTLGGLWSGFMNGFKTGDSSASLGLTGMVGTFDDVGVAISKALKVIGPIAKEVFGFLRDHAKPILIGLGVAFVVLTAPVTSVIAGLAFLYLKFQVVRDVVAEVITVAGKMAAFFVGTVVPAFMSFVNFVSSALAPLVDTFVSRFGEIKTVVIGVLTAIAAPFVATFDLLRGVWEVFHATILRVLLAVWNQIKLVVTTAIRVVSDVIKLVLDVLTGHWSKAWHDLLDILRSVWDLVYGTVKNALSIIGNLLGSLGGIVLRELGKLPGQIIGALGDVGSWLFSVGVHLVEGLVNGIGSMANGVIKKLKDTVMAPVNAVKGLLGISSPSTLFHGFGVNLMQGLANGIGASGRMPVDAMTRVAGSLGMASSSRSMASGGGGDIHVHVAGSVVSEGHLVNTIRTGINTYNARSGSGR